MNRRLAALLVTAAAALAAGVAVGASAGGPDERPARRGVPAPSARPPRDDPDRAAARRLPLRRLAGGAVVMRFDGSPEPAYVRRALRAGRAAGVILFRDNAPTPAATRAMTRRLQRAAGGRGLICTDQEGGAIRTLPWAPPAAAQPALGTVAAARTAGLATGRGLRAAGVNVDLGPVADVAAPGSVMAGRVFPGGPAAVARLVAGSVRGLRAAGVAPVVKHFPGLGAASANTDDTAVTIARGALALGGTDLPPFRAAIAAGAPAVMLSHARYPALDPEHVASQSRDIVSGLLKRRMGFRGVAMTDSLEAAAIRAEMGPGEAAVRSVRAGVDLVLTTGAGSHLRVWRALQAAARRDPAFRARLVDAVARVRALRRGAAW